MKKNIAYFCLVFIVMILSGVPAIRAAQDFEPEVDKIRLIKDQAKKQKEALSLAARIGEAMKASPADPELLFQAGRCYFYIEQDQKAQENFAKAATMSPDTAKYRFMNGVSLKYLKQEGAAEVELKKAVELDPVNDKYWCEYCMIIAARGNSKKALECNLEALKKAPKSATIMAETAALYSESGDNKSALKWFRKAKEAQPDMSQIDYNIGQMYQLLKDHKNALPAFEAALKKDATDWRVLAKLIQENQALGDGAAVEKYYKQIYAVYGSGKVDRELFCREQIEHGTDTIMVFEYFELKGEYARKYSFNVLDGKTNRTKYVISLGSYEATNIVARETGELKPGERLYHLDFYNAGAMEQHGLITFMDKVPPYPELRKFVLECVKKLDTGKMEFQSSTVTK